MKARIVPLVNQKGGVGKTTVCHALSYHLFQMGYHVLILDMDPQCNIDSHLNIAANHSNTPNMYHVIRGEASLSNAICKAGHCDIVQADTRMYSWNGRALMSTEEYLKNIGNPAKLEQILKDNWERMHNPEIDDKHILQREIRKIETQYDYILIDTNPDLGFLTTLSLLSGEIIYPIVPVFPEESSRISVLALHDTITSILSNDLSREIIIAGLLISKYEKNRISDRYIKYLNTLARKMNTIVFKTLIHKGCVVQEAMALHQSIFERSKKANKVSNDYQMFTHEFIQRIDEIAK